MRQTEGCLKSLGTFFLLVFALTWSSWAGYSALPGSVWRWPVLYLGILAPAMVAVALTARAEGRAGVRALLLPLFRWDSRRCHNTPSVSSCSHRHGSLGSQRRTAKRLVKPDRDGQKPLIVGEGARRVVYRQEELAIGRARAIKRSADAE